MFKISKDANPNYLAKVVELKGLRKHDNADRLQCVGIDFQNVITGLAAKDGDIYVYFPLECTINMDYLAHSNSFRDSSMNVDKEAKGFFEKNGRVKAMKLRGEKSMGYIVPIAEMSFFADLGDLDPTSLVGTEFDLIGNTMICRKYVNQNEKKTRTQNTGKSPSLNRLVDGQIHLHVNTANLRRNIGNVKPTDNISVTYKTHGTSFWVSNVIVKKSLKWYEKALRWVGTNINETEYDLIYGSRRVVKNKYAQDPKRSDHFFGYDLWKDIKEEIGHLIPKGFSLYGECIGYDRNGKAIQKNYDYGCVGTQYKLEIYRITQTNADGIVTELSYNQIADFCNMTGLTAVHPFFVGKAVDMYEDINADDHFHENFLKRLEEDYNEKNCFMCKNIVPEEGIVLRKESLYSCESYKLKSFKFLEHESKVADTEQNIEDIN